MAKNVTRVLYTPAQNVTALVNTKVTAGQFVEIAADMDGLNPAIKPATANATAFGVVAHDAEAKEHVMVYRSGHIVEVTADGAIAAGAKVMTAASGKAKTHAGEAPVVGVAVNKAAENKVLVALV